MFNSKFWINALEGAAVTFASTFAGSQVFVGGSVSVHALESAAISAGVAALYAFVKALGAKQAVAASKQS